MRIKSYHNAPLKILEEAEALINDVFALVGEGASHWSLQIGGTKQRRRAEAKGIVLRAKMLEQLVKERTV